MHLVNPSINAIAWTHFDLVKAWELTGRRWLPSNASVIEYNNAPHTVHVTSCGPHSGAALAEYAGRACYQSWDRPNAKTATAEGYIAHLLEVGHLSVLEHGTVTLDFQGVSRSLTHELVRHRHFSFCLSGDTKVYLDRPNRTKEKSRSASQTRTLAELWEMWQDRRRTYVKTMTIRTVTDSGHVVHGHIKAVTQSGVKDVYKIVTADGRSLKASLDHLFWRPDGTWTRLGDLSIGDEVVSNGVSVLHDAAWVRAKVSQGLSTPEIARLAEAAEVTVRKWRRVHGCSASYGSGTVGKKPWNDGLSGSYTLRPKTDEEKKVLSAQKQGELNPQWAGGPVHWKNGNTAANELYGDLRTKCRMCGYVPPETPTRKSMLELDHIDSDPSNNEPSNIQPLCVPCHHAKTTGTPPMKTYSTKIVSLTFVGPEMTYDLEMDGPYKRFVANGLVVHNSQLSQRYVKNSPDFVVPRDVANSVAATKKFKVLALRVEKAYADLLTILSDELQVELGESAPSRVKRIRQAARAILPNATATQIIVTGNYRAWRHFLHLRASEHADVEIREVAVQAWSELRRVAPYVFDDFKLRPLSDGTEALESPYATH